LTRPPGRAGDGTFTIVPFGKIFNFQGGAITTTVGAVAPPGAAVGTAVE
jgi:hypothetical protein